MTIVSIDDAADPRIAAYRDVRERDLVGRQGVFIAEGAVVVRMLLQTPLHQPLSLLVAERRLPALEPLLALVASEVPIYAASQEAMDGIVGFPIHRGILALGRRTASPSADGLLQGTGRNAIVVVAFGIANHDNMGGIFRNAAAFGAACVLLHGDCCDPLYRKAIRVSVGAALTVPFARFEVGSDPLDFLASHGYRAIALSPAGTTALHDLPPGDGRTAVLVGSEGEGLPQSVLTRADSVRIEMAGSLDSLNVATASGIVLHHLAFGRGK
jgi:tRNA G18 (ribose-2'-O)-methylase SpoU